MKRLAIVVAALAVAACGSFHPSASDQPIPWLPLAADLMPPPLPTPESVPVPPDTPSCVASQLVSGFLGAQGATGNFITGIGFAGSGSSACYLDGTPSVTLLDASGKDLGFKQHAPEFPPTVQGPALVDPGPPPQEHTGLKVGEAALYIEWVTQPEACLSQDGVMVGAARIEISGRGSVTVPLPSEPAAYQCMGVGVSTFEGPAISAVTSPAPPLPAISVQAPSTAKAGKPFEYVVTLTNDTEAPINLVASCPNYEEELLTGGGVPLGGKHFYRLNCTPAGTLASGESAKFAMVLDLPHDAAPGSYKLLFNLGYSNAMTRFNKLQPVTVSG
jgi:hypothetical protein